MGSADVVPGVSGGTMALVLGIYERLVAAIRTVAWAAGRLLRGDLRGARERAAAADWGLLVPLVAGIALAVLSLARLIEYLLEERPVEISAVFFGLVAASVVVAVGYLKRPAPSHAAIAAAAAAVTFLVLGLRGSAVSDPPLVIVFGSGALAICAMILPGISGSFILLMVGMYDYMLSALNDRDLPVIAVFLAGCAIGLGLFSSVLDWLLRTHHDVVLAVLIGLMVGSLRVVWPWPEGTDSAAIEAPVAGEWPAAVLLALAGAVVVLALARLARARTA